MTIIRSEKPIIWLLCVLAGAFTGGARAQQIQPWVGEAFDGRACSSLLGRARGFGPYDYRINKEELIPVDGQHFTTDVERLLKGNTTTNPMGDLLYTVRAFPNHHRALYSAVRFSLGESPFSSPDSIYRAECFLQRAIAFAPDDPVPYMLFGLYMHRLENLDQSIEMYLRAEELAPNDANLLYNMGLLYFDRSELEKSRQYAARAYDLGIELPALRRKLQDADYWD